MEVRCLWKINVFIRIVGVDKNHFFSLSFTIIFFNEILSKISYFIVNIP